MKAASSTASAKGEGKLTHENGDIYYGGWVKDRRQGQGSFTAADGFTL